MVTVLVALLAVVAGHLVKGLTGFGSAIVAIPLVTLVAAPADAIVLVNVVDVVVGAALGWRARADVPWKAVGFTLVGMIPAQLLSVRLHGSLPLDLLRPGLGVAVIALAGWLAWQAGRDVAPPAARPLGVRDLALAGLAGAEGGFMSGLVGMSGPPIVAWTQRTLPPTVARAYMLALFVPTSVGLVVGFVAGGLVSPSVVGQGLVLAPAALVGGAIGTALVPRVSRRTFGRVVAVLLVVAALGLVLR